MCKSFHRVCYTYCCSAGRFRNNSLVLHVYPILYSAAAVSLSLLLLFLYFDLEFRFTTLEFTNSIRSLCLSMLYLVFLPFINLTIKKQKSYSLAICGCLKHARSLLYGHPGMSAISRSTKWFFQSNLTEIVSQLAIVFDQSVTHRFPIVCI